MVAVEGRVDLHARQPRSILLQERARAGEVITTLLGHGPRGGVHDEWKSAADKDEDVKEQRTEDAGAAEGRMGNSASAKRPRLLAASFCPPSLSLLLVMIVDDAGGRRLISPMLHSGIGCRATRSSD